MAMEMHPGRNILGGKADDLPVTAHGVTGTEIVQRDLMTGRYKPGHGDGVAATFQPEARGERLQRDRYRISRMEQRGNILQSSRTGGGKLKVNRSLRHGQAPEALLASVMQRRLILLIVLGVLAMVALFVASALLPPTLLAVTLMGLVVLGFVGVAIFWRGE
jgi:hypothetical protein